MCDIEREEPPRSRRPAAHEVPRCAICTQRSEQEIADEAEAKRLRAVAIAELAQLLEAGYLPAWCLMLPVRTGLAVHRPAEIGSMEDVYHHIAADIVDRHTDHNARWWAAAARAQLTALYVAMSQTFNPDRQTMGGL